MSNFLNYNNGIVSINTFRKLNSYVTDIPNLVNAVENESSENLVADLDGWIKEEIAKIDLTNLTEDEARDKMFSECDFLDLTLSKVGIDVSYYHELRDPMNDFINDFFIG